MQKIYWIFLSLFVVLAAVFTLLRTPISETINTVLIAVGEGRRIRVDNTNMVKQPKKEKQVKIKGMNVARAAQIKVFPGKVTAFPVVKLVPNKKRQRSSLALFPNYWAVSEPFPLIIKEGKVTLNKILASQAMTPGKTVFTVQDTAWSRIQVLARDGRIDLADLYRKCKKPSVVWASTRIEVEQEYPGVIMQFGVNQYCRIFLNGKEIFVSTAKTTTGSASNKIPVHLKKGLNQITVLAGTMNPRQWYIYLRFLDGKVPLIPVQTEKTK